MSTLLHRLANLSPVRAASDQDHVDGRFAEVVAYPESTQQVAAILSCTQTSGAVVVARGAGTKLDWAAPPERVDVLVDLSRMDAVLEYEPGDLVVRAQAGLPLAALQRTLASAGQQLAVDEVVAGSTLGGTVATGLVGPRRLRYGSIRDLLIGITVVRVDGAIARAGGKVVKNVAGYDLCKLYTGSYGTLGIITELTLRLHPLPASRRWVSAPFSDPAAAAHALASVTHSQLAPSAVEVAYEAPDGPLSVGVLLEGYEAGVEARAGAIAILLGESVASSAQAPTGWGALPGQRTLLKLTAELPQVAPLLERLGAIAAAHEVRLSISGSAGVGVLFVAVDEAVDPTRIGDFVRAARAAAAGAGGSAIVLRAPADIRSSVDVWGEVPGLVLMRRVKERFDPGRLLAPGRFVGGI